MNQHFNLYLEQVNAAENRFRFYALSIEQTLFGEPVLVRRWGWIGTRGRIRLETCDSDLEAIRLFTDHLKKRKAHAYQVQAGTRGGEAAPACPTACNRHGQFPSS